MKTKLHHTITPLLALSMLVCGHSPKAEAQTRSPLKIESFDRDPEWEGVNNRVKAGFGLGGEKTGAQVSVGYRTAGGLADGPGRVTGYGPGWFAKPKWRDIHLIPSDGTRYTFDFLYDPEANGGTGEITFTLGGKGAYTGGPFTFKLPAAHRKSGATFDAFGIINPQAAGSWLTAYANLLGVMLDGTTSTGPRFRSFAASSDPKAAHRQRDTAALIAPDGVSHTWKIDCQPDADGGSGRLTVWLDCHEDAFALPQELRKTGATFDRFGLFVHEGDGRASRIYLDDLSYTAGKL